MPKEEMTRAEYLDLLQASANKLDQFLSPEYADELLNFRPDIEDAWTIKENLVHILDVDVILYLWIRMAIAETGSKVWDIGPMMRGDWNKPVNYSDQPLGDSIEAFKRIRLLIHHLLNNIFDGDWSDFFIIRSNGEKWTLNDMLRILAKHIGNHLDKFINRNEKLWREQR